MKHRHLGYCRNDVIDLLELGLGLESPTVNQMYPFIFLIGVYMHMSGVEYIRYLLYHHMVFNFTGQGCSSDTRDPSVNESPSVTTS